MSTLRQLMMANPHPLVHYDFSLYTNENHPSTIPNLAGTSYNLTPSNIDFKLMCGFGGFATDFTDQSVYYTHDAKVTQDTLTYICSSPGWLVGSLANDHVFPSYLVKVSGITPGSVGIEYIYTGSDYNSWAIFKIVSDGIYLLPESSLFTGDSDPRPVVGFYNRSQTNGDTVTVEQLPLYPGCFVLDTYKEVSNLNCTSNPLSLNSNKGVTLIVKRNANLINTDLSEPGSSILLNITSNILFEYSQFTDTLYKRNSMFSQLNNLSGFSDNNISWLNSKSYNGQPQNKGNNGQSESSIYIGTTSVNQIFKNAISEVYLFNRDLTQSQIERFISENMVPDPLVYYDVRKQNTKNSNTVSRGKLLDLSGNGNHGVLNNFDYTAQLNKVYFDDEFPLTLDVSQISGYNHIYTVNSDIPISEVSGTWLFQHNLSEIPETLVTESYSIKVTGLAEGQKLNIIPWGYRVNGSYIFSADRVIISQDGVYAAPSQTVDIPQESDVVLMGLVYAPTNDSNLISAGLKIEYLPKSEQVDGDGWVETYIDDEISLSLNTPNIGDSTYSNHILYLNNPLSGWVLLGDRVNTDTQIKEFKVKVSGTTSGKYISFRTGENTELISINSDGVYTIPAYITKSGLHSMVISVTEGSTGTVEFLPQTDYIQFDGVNDYINIPTVTEGFKTVCMLTQGPDVNVRFYDQRVTTDQKYFALISSDAAIAYNALSTGQTYINGELNTSVYPSDLKGDKICIIHRNDEVTSENSSTPYIGVRYTGNNNGPIKLSKFLGFHEYLSDTQIKKVIEKYHLLEGTDVIDMTDPLEGIHYVADWDAKGRSNSEEGGGHLKMGR